VIACSPGARAECLEFGRVQLGAPNVYEFSA
jgi:hypothetical protein